MDSGLVLCTLKMVVKGPLWQVWPSSTLGLCVNGLGVVCMIQERILEGYWGPQRLIISADQNSSGALKDSRSHLFWSKHSVYKAGSSRLG